MAARLIVSREGGFGVELRRGRFDVVVDGVRVGTVDHGRSTDLSIEAGQHTVRMRKGRYTSRERVFAAQEGQPVTFHCHGATIWPTWLASFVKPDLAIALQPD